jgi:hypothetical protein
MYISKLKLNLIYTCIEYNKYIRIIMISCVYKITNGDESIIYVGSTTKTLQARWSGHKCEFKGWIDGKRLKICSIYNHFQEHGIDSFEIHLVSEHEIEDQRQLLEFEQLVIDTTNCVNQQRAYRTDQQRREGLRTYNRINEEKIKARSAERVDCGCGSSHRRGDKSKHQRTQKHQRWLETQQG